MKSANVMAVMLLACSAVFLPSGSFSADLLIIEAQEAEPYSTLRKEVLQGLNSLGFVEGRNLNVKLYSIGNNDGRAQRVWEEEKDNHYDAIYISGTVAVMNFKQFAYANPKYEFIFGAITDPVGVGVIEDFINPPAANFTGVLSGEGREASSIY